MKTFEELEQQWKRNKSAEPVVALSIEKLNQVIRMRLKKERGTIFGYFWASYIWQVLIYASMAHLLIRYGGNTIILMVGITAIVLYVPFTTLLIKKYRRMAAVRSASTVESLLQATRTQQQLLLEFFRFKKRFEWISVPGTGVILTAIIFELWVPGAWRAHPAGALVTLIFILSVLGIAIVMENKKRFAQPLQHFQVLVDEMEGAVK